MKDTFEKFKDFNVLDFPEDTSAVYVVFSKKANKEIPIYVGETDIIQRRIGDYVSASFTASTDFKVGESIRYFQEKGFKVTIKYKSVKKEHRLEEEERIKKYLRGAGRQLLNDLEGYPYKTANEEKERQKVRSFCDNILKSS